MMCQCRWMNDNEGATLWRDGDNGVGFACVEAGGILVISVLAS